MQYGCMAIVAIRASAYLLYWATYQQNYIVDLDLHIGTSLTNEMLTKAAAQPAANSL